MIGTSFNDDQMALAQWIASGLALPLVASMKGDAGYLLNNMVAKVGLAAENYRISTDALKRMLALGLDPATTQVRSRLYGKRSPFFFEHSIPASLVRNRLLRMTSPSLEGTFQVLAEAGMVVIVLREEDHKLREAGLLRSMPPGWEWGDDPLARYHAVGITISGQLIRVSGAICR